MAAAALDAARGRLARHYAGLLGETDRALGGADAARRAEALTRLRADWPQIEPWLAWAAGDAAAEPSASPDRSRLCLDFVGGAPLALAAQLPPAAQLGWVEAALAAARRLGLPADERRLLYRAALLNRNLERPDAVEALARELQGLADAAGDALAAGRAWLLLGRCLSLRERPAEAVACFQACEERLAPLGPSAELADCLGGRVAIDFFDGRYAQALALGEQQLAVAQSVGALEQVGAAHLSLSGVANHLPGAAALALHHAEQALDSGRRCGALRLIAHAEVALGHALRRLGRLDEALAHYEAGMSAPASALPPSSLANAIYGVGLTHAARGERGLALQHHAQALALAQAHPAMAGTRIGEVSREIAHLHLDAGDLGRAADALLVYGDAALAHRRLPRLLGALLAVARWHGAAGDTLRAAEGLAVVARHADRLDDDERRRLKAVVAIDRLPSAAPEPVADDVALRLRALDDALRQAVSTMPAPLD